VDVPARLTVRRGALPRLETPPQYPISAADHDNGRAVDPDVVGFPGTGGARPRRQAAIRRV